MAPSARHDRQGEPASDLPEGVPPFHVHPGHAFEGFELVQDARACPLLLARCDCGAVLDAAEARFAPCPDCGGQAAAPGGCMRCGGSGRVVDHAALQWRAPAQSVPEPSR